MISKKCPCQKNRDERMISTHVYFVDITITGCGSLMKKCVQCRSSIDRMVPFIVCCGGTRKCRIEQFLNFCEMSGIKN